MQSSSRHRTVLTKGVPWHVENVRPVTSRIEYAIPWVNVKRRRSVSQTVEREIKERDRKKV
jgi:hypothetical protein